MANLSIEIAIAMLYADAVPGKISRAQLMERGWDHASDSADRTVDTHVKTLRAKLRAAGAQDDPIRTHRGVGYALDV